MPLKANLLMRCSFSSWLARNYQYPKSLESMATFQSDLEFLELTDIELRSSAEVQLLADPL
jgi:hypothetical protein